MDFSCKFKERGCQHVATPSELQDHMGNCLYGTVECPFWTCKELLPKGDVVNHLEHDHGSLITNPITPNGKVKISWPLNKRLQTYCFPPFVCQIDGKTFLLNCIVRDHVCMFWVSMLGAENDAEKYRANMVANSKGGSPITISFENVQVYSIHTRKEDVLEAARGILEVDKKMVDKMSEHNGAISMNIKNLVVHK